jgi:hypothetical protein
MLTEASLRELLCAGHQTSDDNLVDHTRQNMIRTVYLVARVLAERQDEYVSSRELQVIMAEHVRKLGIPLHKKFNAVDWFSAEWAKSNGAGSTHFDLEYRELFERTGEDPTNYRINPVWREQVVRILSELRPTPIMASLLSTRPTTKVYIANFGLENYLWSTCRSRSTVATLEDEDLRPFWVAGDRSGYMDHCIKTKKTAAGLTPTAPVASRWYNLGHIVSARRTSSGGRFRAPET